MECTALHCTFLIAQTPQDIHNKLSITPVYATLAYYRTKGALARLE